MIRRSSLRGVRIGHGLKNTGWHPKGTTKQRGKERLTEMTEIMSRKNGHRLQRLLAIA